MPFGIGIAIATTVGAEGDVPAAVIAANVPRVKTDAGDTVTLDDASPIVEGNQ